MAYGVKYRGEWRATTRGVREYVVDILARDYIGNISPIYLTGDCATITYGEVDESELQPIKSSEAEITLLCREEGNPYEEFFTLDSSKYQVVITEDEVEIWRGYLATGSYQQPLAKAPYVVRLRANDGMAILKSMPYLDDEGSKHQDTLSISALINRLMSPLTNGVEIWSYPLIYFGQTSSTFDIVGISSSSLYKVFGDKVPTYYDVLEEVLKNFGVQLFQYEGRWCCRSLSMLANAYMSNLAYITMLDQPSEDGYGMKSDATLTFASPLRKMTYTNSESNEVDISDVVSAASNWRISAATAEGLPFVFPYGKAIRIGFPGVIGSVDATSISSASLVFPQVINRSATTKITISADLATAYNTYEDFDYYLGVWLVDAASNGDVVEWGVTNTNPFVKFLRKAYYWNGNSEKWVKLTSKTYPTITDIGLATYKLEKLSTDVLRPSLSTLPTVNATFELPNIPTIEVDDISIERWQIALVVAGVASTTTGVVLPKVHQAFIFNPKITISHIDGVVPADGGDVTISADGINDEAYQPMWRTATESLSVADFMPALIDLSNGGRQVYGYLEASQGIADKDVVAKMLRDLRAKPTRVIEGEVDKPLPAGLNSIAKYDNRNYYISYIRRHLNRGVSTIQMRELLSLNERGGSAGLAYQMSVKSELFALDKSVYWLSNSKLYRIDVSTGAVTGIKDITRSARLSRGVQCVVLSDATYVEAYDDNGERISQILNFASKNVTKDAFISSAKYDKIAEIWLAHNGDKVVVMCDKEGYEIGKWECTLPVPGNTTTDAEILPYNGGFIYRFYSTYTVDSTVQPSYYSFWHCYAIHQAGEFEPLGTYLYGYKNIRRISERFIIAIENSSYVIYHRDLVDMGISAPIKKTTLSSGYEVVDINNGIIVTRDSGGIGVYDTRSTSSSKYYRVSIGSSSSKVALCGDLVFATSASSLGVPSLGWVRVFPRLSSVNTIAVSADE